APEERLAPQMAPIGVKLARRRRLAAAGYIVRDRVPLPEDRRGIAISTLGKVIKRGWDWLGLAPPDPDPVGGLIEVPGLAECLTLNKRDFIRGGVRGASYLGYRKALQEAVARQLAEWGDAAESGERERRRAARPVERDLDAVLMDLAADFPLLASLVEQRAGGQRRLPVARSGGGAEDLAPAVRLAVASDLSGSGAVELRESGAERAGSGERAPPSSAASESARVAAHLLAGRGAERRPGRYGLTIQFEERPDEPELARLVESTVWINESHPAYRRAA